MELARLKQDLDVGVGIAQRNHILVVTDFTVLTLPPLPPFAASLARHRTVLGSHHSDSGGHPGSPGEALFHHRLA